MLEGKGEVKIKGRENDCLKGREKEWLIKMGWKKENGRG